MNFQEANQYLSRPGFERYLAAANQDFARAAALYKASVKIAAAFHPLLGHTEVILRNQHNNVLTAFLTDPNWILNQKTGFMYDSSLTYTSKRTGRTVVNDFLKKSVIAAEAHFSRKGIRFSREVRPQFGQVP